MLDKNNTGDGLITAVSVLNLMKRTGRKLSELASCVQKYPQVLINVAVSGDKNLYKTDPDIVAEIKRAEEKFLNRGRVLIRPSGTENIVRVMIEGENKTEITNAAEDIAAKIREKMA
jgi:phosphoglucosamine mutase